MRKFLFCAFVGCPLITASGTFNVMVPVGVTAPGSSGQVTVNVSNIAGVQSLQWTLSVLANGDVALDPTKVVAGAALKAANKTLTCKFAPANQNNPGGIMCVAAGLNNTPIGAGVLAMYDFTVAPTVNVPIEFFMLSDVLGADNNGNLVRADNFIGGNLLVASLCDLNRDGLVNVTDVQAMIQDVLKQTCVTGAKCDLQGLMQEILVALGVESCQ